jgi:Holliday junction resolvasome RuvABC endonuclease subunit
VTAPPQGGVLALDLSLSTGWALGGINDADPISGVWRLPGIDNLGRAFTALSNELEDAIALHQPRWVVAEAPLPDIRQTSARLLLGLSAHVESSCYRMGVPCFEVAVTTVRATVMGTGRFPKGEAKQHVLAWCARRGWTDLTDDEADARLVWLYACLQLRQQRRGRVA